MKFYVVHDDMKFEIIGKERPIYGLFNEIAKGKIALRSIEYEYFVVADPADLESAVFFDSLKEIEGYDI